jgi:hypothetical protein
MERKNKMNIYIYIYIYIYMWKRWLKDKIFKFFFRGAKRYLASLLGAKRYLNKLVKYGPFFKVTFQIFEWVGEPKTH